MGNGWDREDEGTDKSGIGLRWKRRGKINNEREKTNSRVLECES